ncbi:glycosyl transferase [Polymorphospora rubra]|uniref:Glycosyl transferase n=1 Tax=Polymorphospora rubra TaxID=338584 RepID=A0A810N3P2_9ACTN|nr:glycosyl transferase [Polymorphospora rubra]
MWVTGRLWLDPAGRVGPEHASDPAQGQFFLAHAVRVVTRGQYPFYTDLMNFPDGVNLMANTSMLGLTLPMVPVTMLFGPPVSFAVMITVGLAGTAAAWYFVLSRYIVSSRIAAAVGGAFCGFCPAMLGHGNWHPNIVGQFLVPFIVWRVLVMCRPGTRPVRDGLILAALVIYQVFINEEILLFTAMACGVFLLAYVAQRRELLRPAWKPLLAGLAVCGVVAGTVLAYPLYVQFLGPQSYSGLKDAVPHHGNDIAAYFNAGSTTLAGDPVANKGLAPNYSEENAFFGWPLVVLLLVTVVWLRKDVLIRTLAATGLLFAVLSLGEELQWRGNDLFPGPWALLVHVPLLDSVVPTRFGLITSAVVGVLLAVATERALADRVPEPQRRLRRRAWVAALLIALVPLLPLPYREVGRPPVPSFITSGQWRPYVAPGQTLVPLPLPELGSPDGLRWAASQNLDFAIPRGYFLGPRNGVAGDPGGFGAPPTVTSNLLRRVAASGLPTPVGEETKRRIEDDLRYWNAAIVVLPVDQRRADALRTTMEDVLGPAERVDDVWLWDVRGLTTR